MKRILLKLSGEALSSHDSVLDDNKITRYAEEIKQAKEKDNIELGIVVGGGNFFRGRNAEALKMDRVTTDYMGMMGTVLNATVLAQKLNSIGVKTKVLTLLDIPAAYEFYNKESANKYLEEGYTLIYGGGTGKPHCSTDTASLERASDTKCSLVLMAKSGVDGVYSADPKKDKNAKKYDILTYEDIISLNLEVMDLKAAKIAEDNSIDMFVFNMDEDGSINRALLGLESGTKISKEK